MNPVFIADMTKALAWPVVTLIIALVMRKSVISLVEALRHIKYGGIEAQFDRGIGDVQKSIARLTVHKKAEVAISAPSEQGERAIRQVGLFLRCRFVPTLWDLFRGLGRAALSIGGETMFGGCHEHRRATLSRGLRFLRVST